MSDTESFVYCTQVRTHLGVIQPRSRANARRTLRNMGRVSRRKSGPILYADVCCYEFSLVRMQPPFQGGMLLGTAWDSFVRAGLHCFTSGDSNLTDMYYI